MIKGVTREHLEATNKKQTQADGLRLRGEYCTFMSESARNPTEQRLWRLSANRRLAEAARATS